MAGLKAFIGYDLGDGETITDMVVLDIDKQKQLVRTDFSDMPMPDSTTPGRRCRRFLRGMRRAGFFFPTVF